MSVGLHHQIFLPACFDSVAISYLNVSMLYLLIVSISGSLRSTPCPLRHSTPHTVALPTCEHHTRAGHMLLTSCPCICCTMLSLPYEHDGPACRHAGGSAWGPWFTAGHSYGSPSGFLPYAFRVQTSLDHSRKHNLVCTHGALCACVCM